MTQNISSQAVQHTITQRGMMLILSSPSGAGKTTIARALLDRDSQLELSISYTTRPKRPVEVNHKDYHFIGAEEFRVLKEENDFLEDATVFDYQYGTPRHQVEKALKTGHDVLFDIDWQGAQQLSHEAPGDVVSIFILPPSAGELIRRLNLRAQDEPDVISKRMGQVAHEVSHWREYDYVIINHDIETSVEQVNSILIAERLKRARQVGLTEFIRKLEGRS